MDTFGKYLAERARTQYTAAQRIAAQQAALNAQLKVRQGAATVGGPPVPSYTPRPVASVGGAVAGAIRNVASGVGASVAPYVPVPPPPTIGQRIAAQIVDRAAQVQDTARTVATPNLPPPPTIPMGANFLQQQEEVEPWQVWQSPEGARVAMPTSYTPPETWTPMGDSFNDPNQIENARQSPLAYDNQPPEIQAQIQTPVNQRGMDIGLDQSRIAAEPGPVTQLPGLQGQRIGNPLARVQDATANRVLQAAMEAPAPQPVTPQTRATGPEISSAPYIRVRSARTGEVYVVPKERARNLGPDDEILGTATYQPRESQDRAQLTPGEVYDAFVKFDRWTADTFNNTIGSIFPAIMDYVGQPGGLPRVLNHIIRGADTIGADDAADWVWNTPIYGTDTTLGDVARGIWDLDIEGVSVGNVVEKVFEVAVAGGDDVMTATSDHLYEELSGKRAPESESASIGVIGDVLTSGRTGAVGSFLARPYASWARENPEQFIAIYEGGFDSDGDGTEDTFGADAVLAYWTYNEANIGEALFVQIVTDPFSIVPVIGQGAGRLRNVFRGARAVATTERGARTLRAGEIVAGGAERTMRVLDEAGSMGLGVVLDRVAMPLARGLGDLTRLGRESVAARRGSMPAEAGGTAVGMARRMTGEVEASQPLDIPVTRYDESTAPRTVTATTPNGQGPDPRTPDGGTETAASVRPPAPRSQPTPNLDRGPDLRTTDGGTLPTTVADGEGGSITREVNETGGIIPASRSNTRYPVRTLEVQSVGTVDATGIPKRFNDPIRASLMRNGPDITQGAIDTMRASGRFVDQTALGRAIEDAQGRTSASVDHVLATSDFAAEWNETLVQMGGSPVPFDLSRQMGTEYAWAQHVVHSPWSQTGTIRPGQRGVREQLYATGEVLSRLPANPTPQQMAAAERYADLVDAHRYWNPQSAEFEDFQRAMDQAAEIRKRLEDLEYEGRPTGNIRRGSLLGGGERPDVATNGASDPSLIRQNGQGGFANASQVRKVLLPGENEFGGIGGYPVINEQRVGSRGDTAQTVRLDEDTEALISPIPEARVERRFRRMYPDVQQRTWASALLIDSNLTETVIHHAPDAETAVRAIADEASARGLLNAEAPTPRPAPAAEPLGPPEPVDVVEAPAPARTPTRTAERSEEPRRVWGDVDPETVARPLRQAVEDGWIGDASTAVAFQKNVVDARRWNDETTDLVVRALNDIRVANGTTAPLISAVDLANPATKQWLEQAESLARMNEAIAVHEGILRSNVPTRDAKAAARAKLSQLQAEAEQMRKGLGWKNPSQARPAANVETPSQRDARSVLEGIRPPDKKARAYIDNLRKLSSLEHGPAPVNNLTMDKDGLVRFHGAVLTEDEIAEMTRLSFEALDGTAETFLDRWNRYLTETRANVKTTLSEADDVTTSLAMTMRDYERLVETVYADGKVAQAVNRLLKPMRTYTNYLREKILGSWLSAPRYVGTQVAGNPMLMALGGYGDIGTLKNMIGGIKRTHQETLRMTKLVGGDVFDTSIPILHADRIANQWGTTRAPEVRRHVSSGTDLTQDYGVVEGFFRRHNWPAARVMAAVFGDTRVIRFAGSIDMAARDTVYATAFNRQIRQTITDFRLSATDILMEGGLSRAQAVEALQTFSRNHPTGFTSNDVRGFFRLYLPEGKAERLARDWQSMVNRTTDHARSEVSRVLFAGKETRLDAALKPVIMFHYFMSRQYYFLIRQALHHPILISTYAAYNDYMQGWYQKNKDKVPEWLQGYFQVALFGPAAGYALFINPTSLLQVGNIFNGVEIDFGDPKGMVEEFVENIETYAFISPLITDTLNVLGYLGDRRNVDPLRLMREVDAFRLIKNWGVIVGIGDGTWHGNPIIDVGNQIRERLSGALPGSEEIAYVESANRELREMNAAIEQEAQEAGITDPVQIDAILSDPSDPIYQAGFERYVWGETAGFLSRTIPVLASHRPQVRPINQHGQDLFTNTTDTQRRLINSTEESRAFRIQKEAYNHIGDSQVFRVSEKVYNDVAFSDDPFFDVEVDGVTYTHDQIAKMDAETRGDLAKAWLAEHGLYNQWARIKEEQRIFLSQPENAEYATFRRWRTEVYNYPGGPEAYWEQVAKKNENARQYLDNLEKYLTPEQRERALTSDYAFMAVAGIPVGWTRSQDGEWYATSDYRSPAPKPTNDYDPVDIANQPPRPTPFDPYVSEYHEELRKDLDNYQRYRARDEEVLQQIYADFGLPPDTRLATVDYDTSKAIKKEFTNRTGEYITSPSPAVEEYFLWREENGGGTLEEYIAWDNQQYVAGLPAAFSAEQARPAEGQERDDDAYELWDKTTYRGD